MVGLVPFYIRLLLKVSKNLHIGVGLVVLCSLITALGGCSTAQGEQENRDKEEELSAESALELLPECDAPETESNYWEMVAQETRDLYTENNALAQDPEAACNKGKESLSVFVDCFLRDKRFRQMRVDSNVLGVFPSDSLQYYTLRVMAPDSTGFFASWSYVAPDTATFISGWINSEVLEELTLARASAQHEWHVVEYFSAV